MSKTVGTELKKVVDFFQRNNDVFFYQGQSGSLKYAFTEIAEAVDAKLRNENPEDLRRTKKEIDYNSEIGDTMFMLLASIGIHEYLSNVFLTNAREYLGRSENDDVELTGRYASEITNGVDYALSLAGENIAAGLREDPEGIVFAMKVINAIKVFDWCGDRLDQSINKLQNRCDVKRTTLVHVG